MSFLYPRVVAISRQAAQTGFGAQPPSGMTPAVEQTLASDLSASIQHASAGRRPDPGLPADAVSRSLWRVFIPLGRLARGAVQRGDIVVDDMGIRYQVVSPYWNSLGHNLLVDRLEA